MYALIALSILLIPNALFATYILWADARTTERGDRYVSFVYACIAVTLFLALMGAVGAIESMS